MSSPDSADSIHAQIQGNVAGQVAIGSYILQVGSVHGGVVNIAPPGERPQPRERPGPILLRPRPVSGWLDRQLELETVVRGLGSALPVEISGEPGIGRTALLRRLAHLPDLAAAPHGVVYLNAAGQLAGDLLQLLFDAFYECPASYKPTPAQLQLSLRDRHALLLVDDFELTRDGVERLLDTVPESSVVIANRQRTIWGEAQSIELSGLPETESVVLIERELGRPVSDHERSAARTLAMTLGGHPIRLLQAGAVARQAHASLDEVLSHVEGRGPSALTTQLVQPLGDEDRKVFASMLALEMAIPAHAAAAISEVPDPAPALQRLADRGLVQERRGRYALVPGVAVPLDLAQAREALHDRAIAFYSEWAASHADDRPETIAPEVDTLLRLQKDAATKSQSTRVLRIGSALGAVLAVSGRWEAWASVLDRNLSAARAIGDRAAEGLALHEAGTHALCIGEMSIARRLLAQAIHIRTTLGDSAGAAVSRHNAGLLTPLSTPDRSESAPQVTESRADYDTIRTGESANASLVSGAGGSSWTTAALLIVLGLVGTAGVAWWYMRGAPATLTQTGTTAVTPPAGPGAGEPATPGPEVEPPTQTSPPSPPPAAMEAAVTPSSLEFGARTVNTSGDRRTAVISSRGSRALSVGSVTIGGANAGDFRILSNGCAGAELPGGSDCSIVLGFTPSAIGRRSAQLEIADNSNQTPHLVPLSGEATAAPVAKSGLSPDRLEFERQVVGQPGATRSVRVTNEGNAPLSIERVMLEGQNPRDFTIAGNTCTGRSLAPKDACTVDVSFGPTAAGPRVGLLTVVHNAGNLGRSVDLVGVAEPPPSAVARVSPTRVEFEEQPLGTQSSRQGVTIENVGGGALHVGRVSVAGANPRDFPIVENRCAAASAGLRRGETCVVVLQFAPGGAGARSGVLVVTADDGTRREIAVSGSGVGRGEIAVTPVTIDFGLQELRTSDVRSVVVENTGTAAVTVGPLTVEPRGVRDFVVVNGDGCVNVRLDPRGTCKFAVRFAPVVPENRQAALVVSDATGSRAVVTMRGTGRVPPPLPVGELVFKPARLDFGEQPLPSKTATRLARPPVPASQVVTVLNVGDGIVQIADVLVEPAESSREFAIQRSSCRGVLPPRGECSFTVMFRALAQGPRQAVVVVHNNAPKNPHRVSVVGFGREGAPPDGETNRCTDLVAEGIDFEVLNRRSRFEADVRIIGRARNRGPGELPASAGTIALYEGGKLVREERLSSVPVDQVMTVDYRRPWNSSSPSEGEFPPRYRLAVNVPNDCNTRNNVTEKDGGEINQKVGGRIPIDSGTLNRIPRPIPARPDPVPDDPRRIDPRPPAPAPVIVRFFTDDKPGQPRRLCYMVKGATRARIEPGVGAVAPSVDQTCVTVAPTRTTQYVLIAENADGRTVRRSATMQVTSPQRLRQTVPVRPPVPRE